MINIKFKICPLCVTISGLWLTLSAGVAWGTLTPDTWQLPIALLMGGTVVGIANRASAWRRKTLALALGMPLAYLAVTRLTPATVLAEIAVMLAFTYLLFVRRTGGSEDTGNVRKLVKQMEECC